jgi:Xaa-Pro aminopeptidase
MPTHNSLLQDDAAGARLLEAQAHASALFAMVERDLIRPGITEGQLEREIYTLAAEKFGVTTHWHKRIVRAGPNTLQPYREDPPDRMIGEDDIVFLDFGPVFAAWEADFGRTFVLGNDPVKLRLRDDLAPIFQAAKARFHADPGMTGEALYRVACDLAAEAGWEFGGVIAGHTVGEFPHERIEGDRITFYITRGNQQPIRGKDSAGRTRHWILEIHLVDRARQIGGFYEELLTV